MSRQRRLMTVGAMAAVLVLGAAAAAQSPHVMATLNDANWGPAPPMLPPGAQIAVLSGDPTKAGPYADRKSAMALAPGSYALMPAGMNHLAFTKSETTIILFGVGPVGFTYVNPADDPRQPN